MKKETITGRSQKVTPGKPAKGTSMGWSGDADSAVDKVPATSPSTNQTPSQDSGSQDQSTSTDTQSSSPSGKKD